MYVVCYDAPLSAVLTFLSVANTLQVFKISKQKGALTVSEPTVDFPKVWCAKLDHEGILIPLDLLGWFVYRDFDRDCFHWKVCDDLYGHVFHCLDSER